MPLERLEEDGGTLAGSGVGRCGSSRMAAKAGRSVPLGVLLMKEQTSEKIEDPDILYGQANQSKKGEDFTLLKAECQRVPGDGVTTFSVFAVIFFASSCFWSLPEFLCYLCNAACGFGFLGFNDIKNWVWRLVWLLSFG